MPAAAAAETAAVATAAATATECHVRTIIFKVLDVESLTS